MENMVIMDNQMGKPSPQLRANAVPSKMPSGFIDSTEMHHSGELSEKTIHKTAISAQ